MIIDANFQIDRERRELVEMDTEGFPYVCIDSGLQYGEDQDVPWHWHTAIQINYVKEGMFCCRTASKEVTASKGEIIFVNSGIMHSDGGRGDQPGSIRTQLFDYHFLAGPYGSIMEEKYFLPIISCSDLDVLRIRPEDPASMEMILHIIRAMELAAEEPPGFELLIRNHLSSFWTGFYAYTEKIRGNSSHQTNRDEQRMKHMLRFIQDHFEDNISVGDIAGAASISARECTRCFIRTMGTPPGKYLNHYRLRQAAILLDRTDLPVTEVALRSGFDSSSYFSRSFSALYGCSPRAWRNRSAAE